MLESTLKVQYFFCLLISFSRQALHTFELLTCKYFAMKTLTQLFVLSLFLLLTGIPNSWANRIIKGSVSCDGIYIPDMASVRVSAFDSDGDIDELMGQTYLTNSKTFEIKYENKKWDPFPMSFITWWRPDIYLTVEIYEEEEWITVFQSEIYEDWKTNYDLNLHIYVEFNEPLVKATKFSLAKHGWPFHTLLTEKQGDRKLEKGISGALCFGALDRFYNYLSGKFTSYELFENYLASRKEAAGKSGKLSFQYDKWAALPDRRPWTKRASIAYETKKELRKVRSKIDKGRPVILVLIPFSNYRADQIRHVLVYKYEFDQTRKKTRLWLYDPELGNKGETVLTVIHGAIDGTIKVSYPQDSDWKFRGFFINPYDRKEKRKAVAVLLGEPTPVTGS